MFFCDVDTSSDSSNPRLNTSSNTHSYNNGAIDCATSTPIRHVTQIPERFGYIWTQSVKKKLSYRTYTIVFIVYTCIFVRRPTRNRPGISGIVTGMRIMRLNAWWLNGHWFDRLMKPRNPTLWLNGDSIYIYKWLLHIAWTHNHNILCICAMESINTLIAPPNPYICI